MVFKENKYESLIVMFSEENYCKNCGPRLWKDRGYKNVNSCCPQHKPVNKRNAYYSPRGITTLSVARHCINCKRPI
jgi:hypothetical protein